MAGDWININEGVLVNLSFWNISQTLGLSEAEMLLALFKAAQWMQKYSKHGLMECEPVVLDRITGASGLAKAFIDEGWIRQPGNTFFFTTKFPATRCYVRKGFSAKFRKAFLAGKVCKLCGSSGPLEIDHIVSIRNGGGHDESNLQALCAPCNRRKSSK